MNDHTSDVSSYWQPIIASGDYVAGGLGNSRPPGNWLKRFAHWQLQAPFRWMGRRFPTFGEDLRTGYRIARLQNRQFDLDMMRHVLTLSLLRRYLEPSTFRQVVIIGDGYGTMASLILAAFPESWVYAVNLEPVLALDKEYIARTGQLHRTTRIRAEDKEWLRTVHWRLAINIASMQEMNPIVAQAYVQIIRAQRAWFYCANRLLKQLPDGTVTQFAEYGWTVEDLTETKMAGFCPWHQYYYSPRFPFYHLYDGRIWHRLVRLKE